MRGGGEDEKCAERSYVEQLVVRRIGAKHAREWCKNFRFNQGETI